MNNFLKALVIARIQVFELNLRAIVYFLRVHPLP